MSHTRKKNTLSILNQFKQSNLNHQNQISLNLSLKAITFFLLAQLSSVKAAIANNTLPFQIDKFDLMTKTWYRLQFFDESIFSKFLNRIAICPFSSSTDSMNRNFTLFGNVPCPYEDQIDLGVNVFIEEGKKNNPLIERCINLVISPICKEYNHNNKNNSNLDILLVIIPITALIISFISLYCLISEKKRHVSLEDSESSDNNNHHIVDTSSLNNESNQTNNDLTPSSTSTFTQNYRSINTGLG